MVNVMYNDKLVYEGSHLSVLGVILWKEKEALIQMCNYGTSYVTLSQQMKWRHVIFTQK